MSNNDNLNKNSIKLVQEQNVNTLPHDEEAEEVLLSLLSDNSALDTIENGLSDFHFLFQFMVDLQSICELVYRIKLLIL